MSYDLERAVERVIDRLRGVANAERDNDYLVLLLRQSASELEEPLRDVREARVRDEQRRLQILDDVATAYAEERSTT